VHPQLGSIDDTEQGNMNNAEEIHRPVSVSNPVVPSTITSTSSEKDDVLPRTASLGVNVLDSTLEPNMDSAPNTNFSTRESSPLPPSSSREVNSGDFSDESDDELQDWSLLNNISKKGMKDLEPLLNESDKTQMSSYDQTRLNKARNLRFHALASKRGAIVNLENLKASTIYINVDNYDDLFMSQPKGKFLETMGFIDNQNVCHFGFEEVLYLVERGSCMLKFWDNVNAAKNEMYERMPPLSLQSAYSILIRSEEQLNQYMVYSILKRDGYIINRNEEFTGVSSEKKHSLIQSNELLFKNIEMSWWTKILAQVSKVFGTSFPFKFAFSYFNVFTYLQSQIKPQSLPKLKNSNPLSAKHKDYKISFNVWKPSPNFKKKNPPLPDYRLTIFKATERLPRYAEIKSLLERANSNPDTCKPKQKVRNRNGNMTSNSGESKLAGSDQKPRLLEPSWDYSKGIDMNKLKCSAHRITMAILDNSTINFITLSHANFVQEGPVWRDHWVTWRPPQKKRAQRNYKNKNKSENTGSNVETTSKSITNGKSEANDPARQVLSNPPKTASF
jgi:tRNA-splicing endonuclease subunit Sen54